jgi:hypothetical protein
MDRQRTQIGPQFELRIYLVRGVLVDADPRSWKVQLKSYYKVRNERSAGIVL